ncbi:glycosyltransferase family 4 protein [Knoellia sp. CPCC 206450]|uniref:glycosyltransferase family 4 protein n=1 Tax=Knoellia tibetensis TaxID=3404798 RepID=UPI003B4379AF
MRFHWYWPFARPEEIGWAAATARPGESVLVQVIDRPAAPEAGEHGAVTVVRDLPDVERGVSPVRWLPSRARTYLGRAGVRRQTWRTGDFDLVHLHYLNRFTDAVVPLPSPVVLSVHDVVPHQPRLGRAEERLLRRLYHRGDGLVVHHENLAAKLVEDFDVDPSRVHVVQHQVFPAPPAGPPPADEPPVVLFFGALRRNKGLDVLVEAFARLPDLDARLVIAGRGDREVEEVAARAAATDARVTAEIGFASLDRKQELFTRSSVVVLPYTDFASQSGVLHDAYGHGRPVVVTEVGALGRSVREDGTGLVAAPADPEDLSARIAAALEPTQWARLAVATERVRAERSPQRTGERLREVYDTVLSTSG